MKQNRPTWSNSHYSAQKPRRKILSILVGITILGFTSPALSKLTIPLPEEVKTHINQPIAQGGGALTIFFTDIYDGGLWVETKNENPGRDLTWLFSQKFSLSLVYNRAITTQEFTDYSIQELRRYYEVTQEEEVQYRKKFDSIFPSVKDGDRISALYDPNSGMRFTLNGQNIGSITDVSLAKKYINIWLHPKAKYQRFRKMILGKI